MSLSWNQVELKQKCQYLNFVFYDPEALEKLRGLHIPFCWAFHDKDFDLDDEGEEREAKKAHYHVLMDYGNTTTINHWKKLLSGIPANDYAEITASPRGYYRYLIHEDNPDKYQYSVSDRHAECGFSEYELLTKTDQNYLIRWVNHWIVSQNIKEYDQLILSLDENGLAAECMVVYNHTLHFTQFLKARRCGKWTVKKEKNDV